MQYVVIAFLCLSIVLYFLLGGADFGAGIIEMFTSKKNRGKTRSISYHAIGPIWEANHMWLVIAIVILFVGFPTIYATMSTCLHIPLALMLCGIIARGTAFVFRSYDAVKDNMQWWYNRIFRYSSFITPFFLGIIAASVVSGKVDDTAGNFLDAYVFGWLNWFSVAVGCFTVTLSGYLAAIYLIGEANDEDGRNRFINKATWMNIAAIFFGAVVFIAAWADGVPLPKWVFGHAPGIAAVIAAFASLALLWWCVKKRYDGFIRILAGFQIVMILFCVGYSRFPYFIALKSGRDISLLQSLATEGTIQMLGWALLLGSLIILPALGYLLYSFQKKANTIEV